MKPNDKKYLPEEIEGVLDGLFTDFDAEVVDFPMLDCVVKIGAECRREVTRDGHIQVYYKYDGMVPNAVAAEAAALGRKLGVSPKLAVLYALLIEFAKGDDLSRTAFANWLGISYASALVYERDVKELAETGLLLRSAQGRITLREEALKSVTDNVPFQRPDNAGLTTSTILIRMGRLFKDYAQDSIDTETLLSTLSAFVEHNPETSFSKTVRHNGIDGLEDHEKMLFYALCYVYDQYDSDEVEWWHLRNLISEDDMEVLQDNYRLEALELQKRKILIYGQQAGLKAKDYFKLADSVLEELLVDVGGLHEKAPIAGQIRSDEIVEKELFFDEKIASRISELEQLLSEEGYASVTKALQDNGLRTGFTCLFYGIPGTGKTETVYQLARKTGRDILMVDVSHLKSMWVGESEKNLKSLFARYRQLSRTARKMPILLFNEADAVFGLRKKGAEDAIDKMENALQNIILQEMEDLSGILIATTNLTGNLDRAFERRFLYKLHFENPSVPVKIRIWRTMIKDLSDDEARHLAEEFNFTGGQIENILRKRTIQCVLKGARPTLDDLLAFCREEKIAAEGSGTPIGFRR